MPLIGTAAETELYKELFSNEHGEKKINSSEEFWLDENMEAMSCHTENPALKNVQVDLILSSTEA